MQSPVSVNVLPGFIDTVAEGLFGSEVALPLLSEETKYVVPPSLYVTLKSKLTF